MNSKDFATCLREEILEQNIAHYLDFLTKNSGEVESSQAVNKFWNNMAILYQSLDAAKKRDFLQMIRQVVIDSISNVCGILDGTTILKNYRKDFTLTYANDAEKINGDLQDYFLAAEA